MALQREARRASTLAHPNVVTVYDFDRDGTRIYMTMEYLEGRGLDEFLSRGVQRRAAAAKAWPIIHGIAMALEYGHQKRIVHSDLKPGNIFLCKDGTVKVLDFGIARLINPTGMATEETLYDPAVRPARADSGVCVAGDVEPRVAGSARRHLRARLRDL